MRARFVGRGCSGLWAQEPDAWRSAGPSQTARSVNHGSWTMGRPKARRCVAHAGASSSERRCVPAALCTRLDVRTSIMRGYGRGGAISAALAPSRSTSPVGRPGVPSFSLRRRTREWFMVPSGRWLGTRYGAADPACPPAGRAVATARPPLALLVHQFRPQCSPCSLASVVAPCSSVAYVPPVFAWPSMRVTSGRWWGVEADVRLGEQGAHREAQEVRGAVVIGAADS
ncbi:hypothetical protein Deima_0224 [Deinococcus maricopensis DSM 21211]|uniref:Uncharacterized protein n=1 Tax=Deinococcus maricopensis (strain DSM 21211 / LMG 22137 / NRRL B-23946 / LB-34) TaxID=709986 RepID=E8U451_DEIML|nr:hypothetical protein Deima_0224 [Deinococcus maricopensis DSM 21211]